MVIWLLPFPDVWFLCDRFYPLLCLWLSPFPVYMMICIPSLLRMESPSAWMFFWAFSSRSCQVPHCGQVHSLTFRSLTFVFLYPQHLHVWEEGNHRLTLRKYFPAFSILYFTMVRNCDQPTEAMALERCRFFIMFFTARSSQMKAV